MGSEIDRIHETDDALVDDYHKKSMLKVAETPGSLVSGSPEEEEELETKKVSKVAETLQGEKRLTSRSVGKHEQKEDSEREETGYEDEGEKEGEGEEEIEKEEGE